MKRRIASADGENFALAVHELLRQIRFDDADELCSTGISRTECHVLEVIALDGPMSLNDVTTRMRLNKSTISRVVASLAEKGFIRSSSADEDARRLALSATPRGISLWKSIVRSTADCYSDVLSECNAAEREAVIRVLKRLAESNRK
jgi:DNA-binding MarR family transcriptional regulator